MRFEIKSGGVAAILVGIAALSGAVFMLGLLAGYDVGRENQSSAAQVATAYPIAAPPAEPAAAANDTAGGASAAPGGTATAPPIAAPSPSRAAAAEASPTAPRVAPIAAAKPAAAKHPKPVARATAPEAAPPSERIATEAPPPTGEVSSPVAGVDTGDAAGGTSESGADAGANATPGAPAAPGVGPAPGAHLRHKPYNIQIEAAMDRSGANEMLHRLQALGYQPHLVPAQLNGQTWYKVVIGPYPTQEAAATAQQEMRTKYNNIYGRGAPAGSGAPNPDANPTD